MKKNIVTRTRTKPLRELLNVNVGSIKQLPTKEEQLKMIEGVQAGDVEVIEQFKRANLFFVAVVAKQYFDKGFAFTIEELIEEGNKGLICAAEHYNDKCQKIKFLPYALWWIKKSIEQLNEDD